MATNPYQSLVEKPIYGQSTPVESALPQPPVAPPTPSGGIAPVAKPVSVISTDKALTDVNKNKADMLKTVQEMQARLGIISEEVDKRAEEEAKAKLAPPPIDQTAKDLEILGIAPPEKTAEQKAVETQQAVVDANNKEITDANAKMDAWVVANNETTASIIQNLKDSYAARKRQVEDMYMRQEKSYEQLGIRLGTQRYGGGAQEGILTAVENAKQNKISELDVEMNGLILQAQQASKANEFKVLSERMNTLKDRQDEATKELQELQKISLKKRQEMEKEKADITQQSAIANLIQQGITDPMQLMDYLNYDDEGNFVGGVSIDQVSKVLDAYTKSQKTDNEVNDGNFIDENGMYNVIYRDPKTGNVRVLGVGKTQPKEKAEKALPSSYQEYKLGQADPEYAKFLKEGKGGGATPEGYGGEFEATINLAAQTGGTNFQREQIKSNLQNFIANKDYKSAYAAIISATTNGLSGTEKTNFQQRNSQLDVASDMKIALQKLKDTGYDTNILVGTADKIQTKIGVLRTDPKYAEIATYLDMAFQNYRLAMTGAAFGEAESAEYASVLPSKSNTFSLNLAKIAGMERYLTTANNSAIRQIVGQGGIEIGYYASEIKVKDKATGKLGYLPASEFDPNKYEKQ